MTLPKRLFPTARQLLHSLVIASGIFALPQFIRLLFGENSMEPYNLATDSWGMHLLVILVAYVGTNILKNCAWAIASGMLAFYAMFGPLARFLELQAQKSETCKTNYDFCGMHLMGLGAVSFLIAIFTAFAIPLILGIMAVVRESQPKA